MKPENAVKIEACFHASNEVLAIPEHVVKSNCRKKEVVEAKRFISHYLKWHTNMSISSIGRVLHLNHATILHHDKQHFNFLETDKRYATRYQMFLTIADQFNQPKTLDAMLKDVEYKIYSLLRERKIIRDMIKEFSA